MNVIVTESYEASAAWVADQICALIAAKPDAKLGLATGGTPVPVYRALIEACKEGRADFSAVRTVNLDEYWGLQPDNDQSYRYFMDTNLFDHINIKKENTYVASGLGDPQANCRALDAAVLEGGAPDLQLLGIGANGHIAFNEANPDRLIAPSHLEDLTPSTIQANSRFFDRPEDVPTKAITMGMAGIMAAKSVVLLATGASKVEAIRGLVMEDAVTTSNPSTLLKLHPNATVVIDRALADAVGYQG
ncbi:glucosamine-6-phosphate deaminase [Anaerofilum sp. BX8]|uniref:Glucosamine-6-phosphate deaminase n=1 Tax=Anaerofilum hominis TaxID=2763016 RepID=A0A923I6M2_9FIRM|nr:glucosamine-6-phosphate deaminase [Anaerofilum hominis]MBC5581268.1 glucosamine-6-phosphate deaminase [Anaerofilum hominis]